MRIQYAKIFIELYYFDKNEISISCNVIASAGMKYFSSDNFLL